VDNWRLLLLLLSLLWLPYFPLEMKPYSDPTTAVHGADIKKHVENAALMGTVTIVGE